jgi:hypothetical protein
MKIIREKRNTGCYTLLPTTRRLEPFAEEEREYANFRSREGDPKLSTPACGIH